ncbi:MAG: DUF5343 domain-containing protein [Proteobacteria bacterium]|nr:DUF5343 domain-containing protein [Pseudomonadota bacterium]
MANYPYTQVPGKLKQLLDKIRSVGVPAKVSVQWLKTLGFTSSNDSTMIPVLKFIELIDQSGAPTQIWSQFRGGNSKSVLGDAIRKGYAELYSVYPDAHTRSQTEVENVFKTSSTAGQQAITKTVSTFKALVGEAEFVNSPVKEVLHTAGPLHVPVAKNEAGTGSGAVGTTAPSLHIDIQVHISPDSTPEQIDKIFASMAKHLYGASVH